jgi:hypothetical protein
MTVGLGIDYKPTTWFNIFLSPVTSKTVFVLELYVVILILSPSLSIVVRYNIFSIFFLALKASFLEEDGFLGKRTENGFLFIPGWDFPLSGLKKLEEVLSRRQSCLF